MKTKTSFRLIVNAMFYIMVLSWTSLSFAQCPLITQPIQFIQDAAGLTFEELDAIALANTDVIWYNAPTGGDAFNDSELVLEGTYYAGDITGNCGVRLALIVNFSIDPSGLNLDQFFCTNDEATFQDYIDSILLPGIPAGGSVEIYSDFNLTTLVAPATSVPMGPADYFIIFINSAGDRSQIEIGSIAVITSPDNPTPDTTQEFCSLIIPITVAQLDPGTTEEVSWFDDIDSAGEPIPPALPLSTPLIDGETYFVQIQGFCDSDPIPVTVTIDDPVDAGISTSLNFCEDNIPTADFNLFDELGGAPDDTGIWSGPLTTTNGNLGTVNISTLPIGIHVFNYIVESNNACPDDISRVTITIFELLSSGGVSADNPASFCESDLPTAFNLFSLLDGTQDLGGQWTLANSVVVSPIDLTGFAPGTFNFTYTQNSAPSPCLENSTTVQVIVLETPNAGVAVNTTFCENDLTANSPFDLFLALDGSQDNNMGVWTDANGDVVANPIDITVFTVAGSPFSFTYTIDNGTCSDMETILIMIDPAPESGTVNSSPEFCVVDIAAGQTLDLFDLLDDEDQTGVWNDDTPSNALAGNIVTLDALAPGIYNFTYDVDAIGTCDDDLITVTITINDTPSPIAEGVQEFCDTATVADLIATGISIQWYDEATGGTPLALTTALVDGETYYATQTDATTGCESSVRTLVTVTIFTSPNSGIAVTPGIIECNDNDNIDLNNSLDGTQDSTGIWQDDDATGALTDNIFNALGIAPGTYNFTYFVEASAPCVDASTTITVIIQGPLNAGVDATLNICDDTSAVDLFTLIGTADLGGVWSPALASGTGVFDPLVDNSNTYTYTLTNACGTSSSNVIVSVIPAPDAGTDNTISICVIDGSVDLFTELGGTPSANGVWSPALASGTGVFNPAVDTAGVYTYNVIAVAPCTTDASAQVTVTVGNSNPPILVNGTPEFCQVDNPTIADLDAFITTTGTIIWYTDATLVTALASTDTLVDGEDYFATQTEVSGCESSVSISVIVTVNDAPTPTLINASLAFCVNDVPLISDLTLNIAEFNSTSNNIVWYTAAVDGDVVSDSTPLTSGNTYYAVLIDPVSGCESSVRLEVNPDLTACGNITLPDGFSPNGDGVNDTFDFDNINVLAPNFDIQIFNRNGNIVYKGNASTPRFDGTSNQSRVIGNGNLPVGVYFYILRLNDGRTRPIQGNLYLSR